MRWFIISPAQPFPLNTYSFDLNIVYLWSSFVYSSYIYDIYIYVYKVMDEIQYGGRVEEFARGGVKKMFARLAPRNISFAHTPFQKLR